MGFSLMWCVGMDIHVSRTWCKSTHTISAPHVSNTVGGNSMTSLIIPRASCVTIVHKIFSTFKLCTIWFLEEQLSENNAAILRFFLLCVVYTQTIYMLFLHITSDVIHAHTQSDNVQDGKDSTAGKILVCWTCINEYNMFHKLAHSSMCIRTVCHHLVVFLSSSITSNSFYKRTFKCRSCNSRKCYRFSVSTTRIPHLGVWWSSQQSLVDLMR